MRFLFNTQSLEALSERCEYNYLIYQSIYIISNANRYANRYLSDFDIVSDIISCYSPANLVPPDIKVLIFPTNAKY